MSYNLSFGAIPILRTQIAMTLEAFQGLGCGKCFGGIMFPSYNVRISVEEGYESTAIVIPKALQNEDLYKTPKFCDCDEGEKLKRWYFAFPEWKEIELAEKKEKALAILDKLNIGDRFKETTLRNFVVYNEPAKKLLDTALEYVEKYPELKKKGRGLYLYGGVGVGKTHIVSGVIQELINRYGTQAVFVSVPMLLQTIRDSFGADNAKKVKIRDSYVKAELLVLDDIGAERATDWATDFLFTTINDRYENKKPTIFTSNYNLNGLTERFESKDNEFGGLRIADRIDGMCESISIENIKESYRSKAKLL